MAATQRSAGFAWVLIALGLAAALGLLLGGQELAAAIPVESLPAAITLFYVLLFAPLIVLAVVLGRIERRPVMRGGVAPLRWSGLGLALGVGGLLACVAYVALHGTLRPATHAAVPGWFLALGLAITAMQVLAEEALFRGWLLSALEDRVGPPLAVLLSAAAFSAFHIVGGASGTVTLVNLMLGGMWFALLAQRRGGILAPNAAHYGWNVAEDIGFGLVPNPGVGEFGALADHDMAGAALWGGAEEGLNASIAMTVVLVALLLPLLPAFARRAAARD
jgi:membrane protease YdiL (CAAX protease family)